MIQPPFEHKRAWYMVASLVALVLIVIFSVYFGIQRSSLRTDLKALQTQKKNIKSHVVTESDDEGVKVASAAVIQARLLKIEKDQLAWSKIVEKIEATIPKLKDSAQPIIDFRSYNGSNEGEISVSATTRSGAFDPFADVALLIRAFNNEPTFKNVFVPSITKSLTPEGTTVLSFGLNFKYEKQTF